MPSGDTETGTSVRRSPVRRVTRTPVIVPFVGENLTKNLWIGAISESVVSPLDITKRPDLNLVRRLVRFLTEAP